MNQANPEKTEYLKIAPDALRKQKQWDARQRLKRKDAVPTKQGKKLFDEFMREARSHQLISPKSKVRCKNPDELKNLYNAAHALEFEKWTIFMNDILRTS